MKQSWLCRQRVVVEGDGRRLRRTRQDGAALEQDQLCCHRNEGRDVAQPVPVERGERVQICLGEAAEREAQLSESQKGRLERLKARIADLLKMIQSWLRAVSGPEGRIGGDFAPVSVQAAIAKEREIKSAQAREQGKKEEMIEKIVDGQINKWKKEVSLLDIYKVRDAITAKYRAAGYVLSQAIIPPQQISDGIVRIQVVEGYIGKVEFDAEAGILHGVHVILGDNFFLAFSIKL